MARRPPVAPGDKDRLDRPRGRAASSPVLRLTPVLALAPFAGGLGGPSAEGAPALGRVLVALAVCAGLAGVGYLLGTVDRGGAVTGAALGAVVFLFGGWRALSLLVGFFALGSAATRVGFVRKSAAGLAEARGGRRGAGSALANGAVPAACAVLAGLSAEPRIGLAALAGALAGAAADTVSSEIGQVWGGRPRLITSGREVPPGTDGAISLVGTAAGLAAAAALAALARGLGLVPAGAAAPIALVGLAATTVDSLLGATLERRGLLGNDAVNFLATLTAALLGAAVVA